MGGPGRSCFRPRCVKCINPFKVCRRDVRIVKGRRRGGDITGEGQHVLLPYAWSTRRAR